MGISGLSLRDAEWSKFVSLSTGSTAIRVVGELAIGSVDLEIGAVEIKDSLTDNRATITGSRLWTDSIGSFVITNSLPSIGSYTNMNLGSVAITNIGSVIQSTNPWIVLGSIYNLGVSSNQIIRKACGSPYVIYTFSTVSNSIMIDNLGSSAIYFTFDGTATDTGSTSGYLDAYQNLNMDLRVGSVNIQSSGITSPIVQVIQLS